MYFLNTNFNISNPVAELSLDLLELIKPTLEKDYPEILQTNEGFFVFKRGASAIIITNENLVSATQGDERDFNLNEVVSTLKTINELLQFPKKSAISMRIEGIIASSEDIFEKSRIPIETVAEIFKAQGVGYRFVINKEDFVGDIHIEPYLKDPSRVYINIALESIGEVNFEKAFTEMYNFGVEKGKEASKSLFSL